jgi:hypothetical protein
LQSFSQDPAPFSGQISAGFIPSEAPAIVEKSKASQLTSMLNLLQDKFQMLQSDLNQQSSSQSSAGSISELFRQEPFTSPNISSAESETEQVNIPVDETSGGRSVATPVRPKRQLKMTASAIKRREAYARKRDQALADRQQVTEFGNALNSINRKQASNKNSGGGYDSNSNQ